MEDIMNKKFFVLLVLVLISCSAPLFSQTVPLDARLRGGKIHFQGGRYERAMEQFQLALIDYPTNIEARFWKALTLEKIGKYIEAAANFDTVYLQDPTWLVKTKNDNMYQYSAWNAFIKAGQILGQSVNYAGAINFYRRSTEIFPLSPQGFLFLSQIYSDLDSLEKIKEIAMSLYNIDSTNQQVNILLGMFYFRKEDWDSSLMYYDKAILAFTQDWNIASATIGKELKLNEQQIPGMVNILLKKRATKQLESYVNDTLKPKAKFTTISRLTDQLYTDQVELNIVNFRAGVSALQKANSFKQESLQQKYLKSATNYFIEALRYNELDFDAKYNLGLTYYRSGVDVVAESVFLSLVSTSLLPISSLSSDIADSLQNLITNENLSRGYFEITEPIANKITIEVANKNIFTTGYWYLYYTAFKKSKQLPTVADRNRIFLSGLGIESIENLYLLLGATQTNLKKFDNAIEAFNNVLLLNPKNQDAYRNLAVCYREKGDQKQAYNILQEGEKMKKQP